MKQDSRRFGESCGISPGSGNTEWEDYRIVADIREEEVLVLVVRI